MFKIVDYRNVSGQILITIETDDQMAADFCRFFGSVNKFVDLFHYRMRSAKNIDLYQRTAPHKMALHKKNIADQLERFRSMPGTRIERMRILKEIRCSNGDRVTLDGIDAQIRLGMKYEKENKLAKIKGLHDDGKSLDAIADTLKIPKTTVARYVRKIRSAAPPSVEAESGIVKFREGASVDGCGENGVVEGVSKAIS